MFSESKKNGGALRTRVKICGLTRPPDALAAVQAGADAIGLVFYPPSPRNIAPIPAAAIAAVMPPFVTRVGLFVDAEPRWVEAVCQAVPLDLLQFHGSEDASYCEQFGRPYLKAIRMREGLDLAAQQKRYASASGILLDTYRPGTPGGTGEAFDWDRVPGQRALPLVLAGGLNAENVASAVRQVRPWAVDVSGGVESEPGIKSTDKMNKFIAGVRDADGI